MATAIHHANATLSKRAAHGAGSFHVDGIMAGGGPAENGEEGRFGHVPV
jgi:hypothetical protein